MTYGILTVCLNSAETIARTIDSVLAQSTLPAQYIFVDGGSTDNTLNIISVKIAESKTGGKKIDFQVLHQKTKGGITEAWNIGLATITADVVFILNSDDYYEPTAAAEVLSAFANEKEVGVVVAWTKRFQRDGTNPYILKNRSFWVLPVAMPVNHPACFVKRQVYNDVGFFNPVYRVAADYDFIYRCHKKGVKFFDLKKVLVNVTLGGFAEHHRPLARKEVAEIGQKYHSSPIMPKLVFLARAALGR